MCGFTGFVQRDVRAELLGPTARAMARRIAHRGPDDHGVWIDGTVGLALAHRRLSIVDLSVAGHQPMLSASGRFVLAYNGEIYNHKELRQSLEANGSAPDWRGCSDTETLVACVEAWGVGAALKRCVGMFAFALWDKRERTLVLARDRIGEKPLYYGWQGDLLLFGSELKAFEAHPKFRGEVDRGSLALLLRHNCIPAPYSIYRGVAKLMPGHYVCIPLRNVEVAKAAKPEPYWKVADVMARGLANPFDGSADEAVDALQARLSCSIGDQMLADVPLGAFLSGGVDSSTVVALMQAQSTRPVRTFSIGIADSGYDEAADAKAVAGHLKTDHTELYVRPEDALRVIPCLSTIYCEPFSDSSQIPTFLVSQLARQHVSVALSGDGGDELFGGYNRYVSGRRAWELMQRMPRLVRHGGIGFLRSVSPSTWDRLFELAAPLLPRRLHLRTPGDKAHKLADVLAMRDGQAFLRRLTSHWQEPEKVVIGASEPLTLLNNPSAWPEDADMVDAMMLMDMQTFLPDDILVKVDRAAMAASLDTRVPMLDHRVLELAWSLPLKFKIRDGQGKWLLRQVFYRHVPRELIDRPKMGFGIPLDQWLRGPLRDWAEDLLHEHQLREEGYFHPEPIRRMWSEHVDGRRNWQHHLWDVLMFQAWLRR